MWVSPYRHLWPYKIERSWLVRGKMAFWERPFKPSTTTNTNAAEKAEVEEEAAAGHLLEEGWFFGNLLHTKTRTMSRCCSDPASSPCSQEILANRWPNDRESSSFASKTKFAVDSPTLMRTPSLPAYMAWEAGVNQFKDDQEDGTEDEESEFTMGRLIRQASLNSSRMRSTPTQTNKCVTQSLSLPRCPRQEKNSEMGVLETSKERRRSKTQMNTGKNKGGNNAPKIPGGWVDKSSAEDMKAQIKFWARAVASNVHQEC